MEGKGGGKVGGRGGGGQGGGRGGGGQGGGGGKGRRPASKEGGAATPRSHGEAASESNGSSRGEGNSKPAKGGRGGGEKGGGGGGERGAGKGRGAGRGSWEEGGGGGGGEAQAVAGRGKGKGKGKPAKAGDTMEMGGIMLVAVKKDGRLAWEPVNALVDEGQAQKRALAEETRWLKDSEAQLREQRMAQARELKKQEQQRKAEMLGSENVFRTQRSKGPLVKVPKLLADTRAEEEKARRDGMDKSEPKKYMFLKESLVALEKEYAEQLRIARERAYEQNRLRLKVSSAASADVEEEEEEESMAAKMAKLTDEEFKALAMERKQRAAAEVAAAKEQLAKEPPAEGSGGVPSGATNGATPRGKGGGGKGSGGKGGGGKKVPLDPKDDPDYRR